MPRPAWITPDTIERCVAITKMRYQFSVQRLLSARLESIETTTRQPSVEIQRMFLFERSHWTTLDVKQGSRGLERSENGFLLDLEDPLDRSVDRDGGRRRKYGGDSVRKEGRKEGREKRRLEIEATSRLGGRPRARDVGRRPDVEKSLRGSGRPVWNRHRVSAREKADSRGVFLRWRSHALPDFRAREDEIHPDRKREEKGGNLGERCRIRREKVLRSPNNDGSRFKRRRDTILLFKEDGTFNDFES